MLLAVVWTSPIRRSASPRSDQSDRPVTAVGTAVAIPTATRASAAGWARRPPTKSSSHRARPRPDREIGQQRVQWVAEPRSTEHVLQPAPTEQVRHCRCERRRDTVESRRLLDPLDDRIGQPVHRRHLELLRDTRSIERLLPLEPRSKRAHGVREPAGDVIVPSARIAAWVNRYLPPASPVPSSSETDSSRSSRPCSTCSANFAASDSDRRVSRWVTAAPLRP